MTDRELVSSLHGRADVVGRHAPSRSGVSLARAVRSPATWLVLVIGLSTLVRAAIALRVPSPWILPDEVVYSDVAKSIAAGTFPSVHGVHQLGWGVVYQAIIAPAWAVFTDPVQAYHAALVINALVMSLTAIPAYFLARMFVSRPSSVVVAAMTVLVPSMAYTGVVMTENVCYPAFVLSVLLIARAVRSPSIANQTSALVGLALVAMTRIQGIALVGAYLAAIGAYAVTGARGSRRAYVRRFIPTAAVALAVSFAPAVASISRGDGVFGWLGPRSGTFADLHPNEIPKWFVFLVAGLVLYVAVAPAAASAMLVCIGLSRHAPEHVRLFAAVALPTFAAMLISVSFVSASLDVDGTENLNERYVFYVVPLLLVGLALWIRERLPRPRPAAELVVALCCVLPALLPIHRLSYNAQFQSLALLPWINVSVSPHTLAVFVGVVALAAGLVWLRTPGNRIGRLWLLVAVWMTFVGAVAVSQASDPARYYAHAYSGQSPNWVDANVPTGASVSVVWDQRVARPGPDFFYFWLAVTEFFNRSVDGFYSVGGPTYYDTFLPSLPLTVSADRVLDRADGSPLRARFVLATCRTPIVGKTLEETSDGVLRLVEVPGRVRLSAASGCDRARP